jgi:hypothetical protein
MMPDVQGVQANLEGNLLALQPAVERTALHLSKSDPALMVRYLTDHSLNHADQVVRRWRELGEHLLTRFNDGYVKDEEGHVTERGYPEAWLRRVIDERPKQFRPPAESAPESGAALVD